MTPTPFLPVLLWYVGGVLAGAWLALPIACLFVTASLALAFACLAPKLRPWLIGPTLLLAGWTNLVRNTTPLSPVDLRHVMGERIELATVRGRLAETPTQRVAWRENAESWRTLALIEANSLDCTGTWQRVSGTLAVDVPGLLSPEFFAGQMVEVYGVVEKPPGPAAPGLFDYREYLRWKGIYYRLQTRDTNDWRLIDNAYEHAHSPWGDRFVNWAQQTLALGLPVQDEPLRLIWAMALGWKTALTDQVSEPFMQTGTMHIFAISGLHIALIAGILVALMRVAQLPRRVCGGVVLPLIWFYTAATGWQSSAIRSSIMMTVVILGWALRRPGDLLNSLAASGFIILIWDPRQLFQASFQLSFFVVLSMALLMPRFLPLVDKLFRADPFLPPELQSGWRGWVVDRFRRLAQALATSLSAWVGSLPLIAFYFHLVTPVSLLANLVIVPLSAVTLMCNLGSLFCGAWAQWLSVLFNHSAWLWMRLMIGACEWAAQWPGAFFRVPSPPIALVCVFYLLLMAAAAGTLAVHRRLCVAGIAALLALLVASGWWLRHDQVTISILPLRGGHAMFIDKPGKTADVLIDCGNESSARFVIKPFLQTRGIKRLPLMFLTHGDVRHTGGASFIVDQFRVKLIATSHCRFRSPTYRRLTSQLAEQPNRWLRTNPDDTIGGFTVVHPAETNSFPLADDNALVLDGAPAAVHLLFLSDLGPTGQETLLQRGRIKPGAIVVAGIPSTGEPLSGPLIDALLPSLVVVAESEYPAPRQIQQSLRKRLLTRGIPTLYTSETGAVTIRARHGRWRIETMSGLVLSGSSDLARLISSQQPVSGSPGADAFNREAKAVCIWRAFRL